MPRFHETLIGDNADLLKQMCHHPFLQQMADGTIPDERFLRWLTQDYLWIREFEQALAILASRAPRGMRRPFFEALLNLHAEIELFEETAARAGADISKGKMSLTCHAYANFLLATSVVRSFEEALVVFYASEQAYLEAWSYVKLNQTKPSPWQEFIELWTQEGYRQWVDSLGRQVDAAAEAASPTVIDLMKQTYRIGLDYELRFWSMAFEGDDR